MATVKSLLQEAINLIAQSKFNLILKKYPEGSLEAVFFNLLESNNEEKICKEIEKYFLLNGFDEFLKIILSMEIGITRVEFFNWLATQYSDYKKWVSFIENCINIGYPEIWKFMGAVIKSKNTDASIKSKMAAMQVDYSGDDWQYLIKHPLSSDYSSAVPKLNTNSRKLRIAYLSEKFATNYISSQTIFQDFIFSEETDNFEIYLFALKHYPDKYTEVYRKKAHQFIDLSELTEIECRAIIKKAQIDIVVDFAGTVPSKYWKFFEGSIRVGICHSHTFIKNYYHYIIAREEYFPDWQKHFTNLYATSCDLFLPNLSQVDINTKLPSTANKYITFGCFSRLAKMTPSTFDTWAKLLTEVQNSRIAFSFIQLGPQLEFIIIKEFSRRGIDASRLVFFPRTDPKEHLEKYNNIDLVIDSFPAGSGFSLGDALWMGVPIITMSILADSLLKDGRKTEWIAKNEVDYINLCKKFALDEPYRKSLKLTLRQDYINSDIMNSKKCSKELYRCLKDIAYINS